MGKTKNPKNPKTIARDPLVKDPLVKDPLVQDPLVKSPGVKDPGIADLPRRDSERPTGAAWRAEDAWILTAVVGIAFFVAFEGQWLVPRILLAGAAAVVAHALAWVGSRFLGAESRAGLGFALLIVVLGFVAYANNLAGGWHFDDAHSVLMNDAVKNPSFAAIYKNNNYRQVLYWIFAGSWSLHGMAVRGWHIENNLIHVVNGLLVYGLALVTLRTPAASKQSRWPHVIAGLAGALFVLHPLQTQAVTYITQRTESLCATFYLGAMLLYAGARLRRVGSATPRGTAELAAAPLAAAVSVMILAATFLGLAGKLGPFLVVSALAGVGALAALVWLGIKKRVDPIEALLFTGALLLTLVACETKEIAGTIPLAMILWEVVFMRPPAPVSSWLERARAHASVAPYAAMIAFLPLLALAVGLGSRFSLSERTDSVYDIKEVSGHDYVLTQLNVLATYTRLYLLPWGQSLDYNYVKRTGLLDGPTLLSLGAFVAAVALAVRVRRTQPVFTFSVFFMIFILLPTSIFVLPDFIFEHRVYLPLAGAALVTALLAERVVRAVVKDDAIARRALVGGFVPVLVILLVLTRSRNEVWATDETLWKDSWEKTDKKKPRPLTNLGLYYQNVEPQIAELSNDQKLGGKFDDGAQVGQPDLWFVTTTFPNPQTGQRQFTVKKGDVKKGPEPWGGLDKAEEMYLEALKLDADYYKARNNYALCEIQKGVMALDNARDAFQFVKLNGPRLGNDHPAVKKAWDTATALENEALAHLHAGEAELKTIIAKHPDDNVSLMNLGNLYFGYLDRLDDAIKAVEESIRQNDKEPIAHAVLGEIYFARALDETDAGKLSEARADYAKAIATYRTYLERSGASDAETYKHVQERKEKSENGTRHPETRPEPKPTDGSTAPNPFRNVPGMSGGRGARWKPGERSPGERPK